MRLPPVSFLASLYVLLSRMSAMANRQHVAVKTSARKDRFQESMAGGRAGWILHISNKMWLKLFSPGGGGEALTPIPTS